MGRRVSRLIVEQMMRNESYRKAVTKGIGSEMGVRVHRFKVSDQSFYVIVPSNSGNAEIR